MIEELLYRFSTKEGYAIYPDAFNLFKALRVAKKSGADNANWLWGRATVTVLSNSDDRIIKVLESLDLSIGKGCDIEKVILSYHVGAEKPDVKMFEHAAKDAPENAVKVHVGDELAKDAMAAIKAGYGWNGLLLDRERKYEEWSADQEHHGLVKVERDGHIVPVIDSLDALRKWQPSP
jgi:HAD superfamily hydrolase (TIGR01549 family)